MWTQIHWDENFHWIQRAPMMRKPKFIFSSLFHVGTLHGTFFFLFTPSASYWTHTLWSFSVISLEKGLSGSVGIGNHEILVRAGVSFSLSQIRESQRKGKWGEESQCPPTFYLQSTFTNVYVPYSRQQGNNRVFGLRCWQRRSGLEDFRKYNMRMSRQNSNFFLFVLLNWTSDSIPNSHMDNPLATVSLFGMHFNGMWEIFSIFNFSQFFLIMTLLKLLL